jgi:hypothetical protein
MAQALIILGIILAWGALLLQATLLWKEDKPTAIITLLFWPAALVVALRQRERFWLGLVMIGGIALGWVGFTLR